jgi:hypothetical protein
VAWLFTSLDAVYVVGVIEHVLSEEVLHVFQHVVWDISDKGIVADPAPLEYVGNVPLLSTVGTYLWWACAVVARVTSAVTEWADIVDTTFTILVPLVVDGKFAEFADGF